MRKPAITGLGFVASGARTIQPGHQYDKYFDTSQLVRSDKVVLNGTTFDALNQMKRIVRDTLDDTKAISKVLKVGNRYSTSQNIWNFLYKHVNYVKDSIHAEELRRPLRLWADRKGDCDCYSIFISSVLTNLGIDHAFRMAGYKEDFQHVYVVVPKKPKGSLSSRSNYIVIDPVTDQFDHEVPYSKKFDKIMNMPIKYLNGIDNPGDAISQDKMYNYPYGFEFATIGMDGLGSTDKTNPALLAEDFVRRMQMHLINTHKELTANPAIPGAGVLLSQIDQVLRVWGDPIQRDTLIAQFSTGSGGLSGLGGFFDKIGDGLRKVGKAIGNGWEKVKEVATKVGTAVLRYNPVTASARLTVEGVFRNNLFNASTKLGYGYWSEQQARANGMDLNHWRKYVDKKNKVEKLWIDFLAGKKDKLKEFILMGHQTGTKKRNLPRISSTYVGRPVATKASGGFAGLGYLGADPVTAVVGSGASATFIGKVIAWLKELIDPKELFHKAVDKIIPAPSTKYPVPAYSQATTYPAMQPGNTYIPEAPVQASIGSKNMQTAFLVGAGILAAVILGSGGSDIKTPQKRVAKSAGMSGTPVKRSTRMPAKSKGKRQSVPTMVMS